MGTLSEDEIKQIIRRATILQKYQEQSPNQHFADSKNPNEEILEIGESIGIQRQYMQEALFELTGAPTEDPVLIDTGKEYQAEIQAFANGSIDSALLNELRAQIEYHFDNVGTISRRKGNLYWNIKPAFPRKLFEITNSPQVVLSERNNRVKIGITQSLKTINKFYAPAIAATFGASAFLLAVMFDNAGNEQAPFLIMTGILLTFSFFYARFIKNKKLKRKKKLVELAETLQQIIERRFRAGRTPQKETSRIVLEDLDDLNETDEISVSQRNKANI